jgi:phosphatidylinositol phospholipase C, beta
MLIIFNILLFFLIKKNNSIIKLFASHKDDKRRVEKALEISGLPIGKTEAISVDKMQFEDFFNLYKNLTLRQEVEKIFDDM